MPSRLIRCPSCDRKAFWRKKQNAFVCKHCGRVITLEECMREPQWVQDMKIKALVPWPPKEDVTDVMR